MSEHCPNPNCGRPIPPDQAFPWCAACGVWFPESLQLELPKLQEVEAEARRAGKDPWAKFRVRPEVVETCVRCGASFKTDPQRDNLGFRERECPHCHQATVSPLPWAYRIIYWVALCCFVFGFLQALLQRAPAPGVMIILLIVLLLKAITKDLWIVCGRWSPE